MNKISKEHSQLPVDTKTNTEDFVKKFEDLNTLLKSIFGEGIVSGHGEGAIVEGSIVLCDTFNNQEKDHGHK